jgi:predicted nucleic acid-binding protein
MRLLLDTDILIDVALDRAPFAEPAAGLLNELEARPGMGFIAWHSATNFYYLLSSEKTSEKARLFIKELAVFVEVAPVGSRDLAYALSLDVSDFEDAMQVAAAVACKADWIVTRNTKHYGKSPVKAILPHELLIKLGWGHPT